MQYLILVALFKAFEGFGHTWIWSTEGPQLDLHPPAPPMYFIQHTCFTHKSTLNEFMLNTQMHTCSCTRNTHTHVHTSTHTPPHTKPHAHVHTYNNTHAHTCRAPTHDLRPQAATAPACVSGTPPVGQQCPATRSGPAGGCWPTRHPRSSRPSGYQAIRKESHPPLPRSPP